MMIGKVGLASKSTTLGDPEQKQAEVIQEHTDQNAIGSSENTETPAPTVDEAVEDEEQDTSYFGDLIPFGDPSWVLPCH